MGSSESSDRIRMRNPDFSGKIDHGAASLTLRQPLLSPAQINHSDFWIGSGVLAIFREWGRFRA